MNRVTASAEELMKQAGYTADVWLRQAVESIDREFGDGFAKENPELVSGFMGAASMDMMAAFCGGVLQDSSELVSDALKSIADRLG